MTCDEPLLIAYLAGDLDGSGLDHVEQHLLECDSCWTAVVQDRQGRQAAEQLRELCSPQLRDRIRAMVQLSRPNRKRQVSVALSALFIVVLGLAATGLALLHRPREPRIVTRVLQAAKSRATQLDALGDGVRLSVYDVDGSRVVVARSADAFPMPMHAMPLGGGAGEPWIARRGTMSLVCVSRPAHILLAGRVPPARLLAFAQAQGLVP